MGQDRGEVSISTRCIDEGYVERAAALVRRVMGVPEDTTLLAERWVFDLADLVAAIAVELEEQDRRMIGAMTLELADDGRRTAPIGDHRDDEGRDPVAVELERAGAQVGVVMAAIAGDACVWCGQEKAGNYERLPVRRGGEWGHQATQDLVEQNQVSLRKYGGRLWSGWSVRRRRCGRRGGR